ncbi:MAG: outer membrane lipoprotein carrier protein LolA [Comamonadaceae bacterium CG12_big_fil_rev_8_21_14_0_65_59_15]|nr:MAG: outer membrane lipoprotein carrier protein LolA [Comamonadaceae bacterium CG12_big_fil_rev_8_21_14_0_65_59_15]
MVLFVIAFCASNTWATGLRSLEDFMHSANTGKAQFTQVVTSAGKNGQASRVKKSSGTFEFIRPDRFRFNYLKPFAQIIVADGQTLWVYDADLNQVTARRQASALGSTPAALIATATNLKALSADFVLTDASDRDGLQWVLATPRANDGQLQSVQLGFLAQANAGAVVKVLEILDNFGQRSVLTFENVQINAPLASSLFEFKPPKGADVIRQ